MNTIPKLLTSVLLIFVCSSCGNNTEEVITGITDTTSSTDSVVADDAIAVVEEPDEIPYYSIDDNDTIKLDQYLICFSAADIDKVKPNNKDERICDSIRKGHTNSHEAAWAIEDYYRSIYDSVFSANDSVVTIRLTNSKSINFLKWDGKRDEGFSFYGYYPAIDYVALHVQYGEGDAYMLVNRKNGFKQLIIGKPNLSPNGESFIVTSADLEAHYNENGIQYYKQTEDTLVCEFIMLINNCGPERVQWLSDNEFLLERYELISDNKHPYKYSYLNVQLME